MLQTKSARVNIFSEGGAIYSGFTVSWYEGARLLGEAPRLEGLRSGMQVRYEVSLDSALSGVYTRPEGDVITISENDSANFVTVNLIPLQSQLTKVTGSVQSGGNAVAGVKVIFKPKDGDNPTREFVAFTDTDGHFKAEVSPEDYIVEVMRFGFLNRRWNLRWNDHVTDGAIPGIQLERAEGLLVRLNMECVEASAEGDSPVISQPSNTNNINFAVYNVTQNKALTDIKLSGTALVLPDENIQDDDTIKITAADTAGNMLNAEISFTAWDYEDGVTISFTQNGYWQAREFTTESPAGVVAFVYDKAGKYIATHNPVGRNITGNVLPEGQYTVVFIGRSPLLRHLADLSGLAALKLTENIDYVKQNVSITAGVVSVISDLTIPALDETKLYYTDTSRTSFTANRVDVTTGALVTMRAEFSFPPSCAGQIRGSTIVIRMPDDSELIPNSVTLNGRASDYRRTAQGFEVRVPDAGGTVRFLAVPRTVSCHVFEAFIRFEYQNIIMLQPVGTAIVKTESLRVDAPAKTARKVIAVKGAAEPNHQVRVFANDNEVGATTSSAGGSWQLTFELTDPSEHSAYDIYAEVAMGFGAVVRSETVRTIYEAAN